MDSSSFEYTCYCNMDSPSAVDLKTHLVRWLRNPYIQISVIAYSILLVASLVCWYFYCFWLQQRKERAERRNQIPPECPADIYMSSIDGADEEWTEPPAYEEAINLPTVSSQSCVKTTSQRTANHEYDSELPTYESVSHITNTRV